MDKLKLTGQNPSRVLNSRYRCACLCHGMTQPQLKTQPKQLLGHLSSASLLPVKVHNIFQKTRAFFGTTISFCAPWCYCQLKKKSPRYLWSPP